MNNDIKIVVALDFDKLSAAEQLVEQLDPAKCRLKVGKEMFTRFGPDLVTRLVNKNFSVFLDLKFHDIPNTVKKACLAAADLGVWMINVHCSGGAKMMEESANALATLGSERPLLTGVTVLTSMSESEFSALGMQRTLAEQVFALAGLAKQSGLDGVVCSAHEASQLKQQLGHNFKLVTPGIRPIGADIGDQSRVMTPPQAIAAGSDYLVIGRPITQADNPLRALCEISDSIAS